MGDQRVAESSDELVMRNFMKALLNDVRAFETLLASGMFETSVRRIGAEQEFFLVDRARKPICNAIDLIDSINDDRFTFELAQFNLEANLTPLVLGGDCLRRMEEETAEVVNIARQKAQEAGHDIVLTGILPTLGESHLTLENMVPKPRYKALNDTIVKLRGDNAFKMAIKGLDDLDLVHDNVMLESCNASFQIHFQVAPDEFAKLYNIAQAVTGPVMAAACNSPMLLGKRLWHETRIAVFEHSVDARSDVHRSRGLKPRVHFGDHWIDNSVLEIFREDIARFRVVLTADTEEDPMAEIEAGRAPKFNALRLHNGTVYRWNRACYGITDGKPHLRIEHRILPSGPSVVDEIANAALFFGLMSEFAATVDDVRERMQFDDARTNFFAAARYGLKAQFSWFDGKEISASRLLADHLIPAARRGLERVGIDQADIDRYLSVIEQRVESQRSGARWILDSYSAMDVTKTADERLRNVTSAMVKQQQDTDLPVHEWPLAEFCQSQDWRDSYRTVNQFMTTDLFTVRPDDLVDFAASLMDWKHVRHVPVEDDSGHIVGLVSHRALLRMIAQGVKEGEAIPVSDIMNPAPVTVDPGCPTVEAIRMMREMKVACLPVVKDGKLVGVVTEADLIGVAGKLLETFLEEESS